MKLISLFFPPSIYRPPFISSDPLQTYHIILRGFDSIGFDENIFSKHCVNLIRSLCRENPNERLIIRGRNGYNDIKRHKWFTGFNWNNLLQRKMIAPIVPKLTSNTDTRHFECFNTDDVIDKVIGDNNNNDQKPNSKEKSMKNKHSGSTSSSWFKSLSNCSGSGRNSLSNKKTIKTPEQQQQRTDHKNNSGGGGGIDVNDENDNHHSSGGGGSGVTGDDEEDNDSFNDFDWEAYF